MKQFSIEINRQLSETSYFKLNRREGRQAILLALLIHGLLFLFGLLFHPIQSRPAPTTTKIVYDVKPDPVDPRFFETNPNVRQNDRVETASFSNRDQRAAQPMASESRQGHLPTIDGTESETQKIVDGDLRQAPSPVPIDSDDMLDEGLDAIEPQKNFEISDDVNDGSKMPILPEERPKRYPSPTMRPRLKPRVIPGDLLKSPTAVNSIGEIAIDAQASEFGDYLARLLEAISYQWEFFIERLKFPQTDTRGFVVVEVLLQPDGTIDRSRILASDLSQSAALICQDAIVSLSPFEPWDGEMKKKFGHGKSIRIKFHYR